jgi:O-methyltransferase involved in polyketide biosynthesis
MAGKISVNKLEGVRGTLLYALRARYMETRRQNGVINDPKSVEIMEAIDYDFSKFEVPWSMQISVCTRMEIFDEVTDKFLEENPDSAVVNLGCGLDTRFARVDIGRVLWYDLDLPEVIEIRKNFFQETERVKFIAKSVLDFSWVDEISKDRKTLFLAAGLLPYFTEDQVKSIIKTLKNNFLNSELLFEAISPWMVWISHGAPDVKGNNTVFKWGIKTGRSLEKWDNGIKFLEEWYYVDRYPHRWKYIGLLRFIPLLGKVVKSVHLRLI